jgi:hypothetical protein
MGIMRKTAAHGDTLLRRLQRATCKLEREIVTINDVLEKLDWLRAQGVKQNEPGDWTGRVRWVGSELAEFYPRYSTLLADVQALAEKLGAEDLRLVTRDPAQNRCASAAIPDR